MPAIVFLLRDETGSYDHGTTFSCVSCGISLQSRLCEADTIGKVLKHCSKT